MFVATLTVIVFAIAYLSSMYVARDLEAEKSLKNRLWFQADDIRHFLQREKVLARERQNLVTQRYDYIRRCTEQLSRLNDIRQRVNEKGDLALETLRVEQVCIALPVGSVSDEISLVSLAGVNEFDPLSSETERAHYEYLEDCSLEQAAAIVRRRNQSSAEGQGRTTTNGDESLRGASVSPSEGNTNLVFDSIDIGQVCPALAVTAETMDESGP